MQYLGYSVSLILFILTFVFFILNIYTNYKDIKSLFRRKLQVGNSKYLYWSFLTLSLSLLVFMTTENGFSWDILCISAGLLIMSYLLLGLDYVIRSKTIEYTSKYGSSILDIRRNLRKIKETQNKSGASESFEDDK